MALTPDDPKRWAFDPAQGLKFGGIPEKDSYKEIWRPNTNILSVGYSVNNKQFKQSSSISFSAAAFGGTSRCSSSTDCGAGFVCSSGVCVPSGGGNTYPGSSGTGCNSGQNGVDTGTPGNSCGGKSGTGLGDCYQAGCGQGGNVGCASDSDSGPRCCRYSAGKGVQCYKGYCPPEPDGCSSYCTGHKASYGESGPSCDGRNECSECTACEDGQCVDKADKPCHCDESCEPPGPELICCSYRDTCEGRLPGPYCHETYRTYYPRCYDPDHACPSPPPDPCRNCTTGEGTSVPDGCQTTGTITVGSNTRYTYECCTPSDAPECQPPVVWVRMVGTMYGNGFYGPPEIRDFTTQWYNATEGYMLGAISEESTVCLNSIQGGPGVTGAARTIKNQSGCASTGTASPVGVYKDNVFVAADGGNVGFSWFYPDSDTVLWWFSGTLQYSFNKEDIFRDDDGFKDPSLPDNPPYP